MTSIRGWNEALLSVLLPSGPENTGRMTLLSCDEKAVEAAAASLEIRPEDALAEFAASLRKHYAITSGRGVKDAAKEVGEFERASRPRPTPPFLAVLAATVLAASRMNRDERLSTLAYYQRLLDLLGVEARKGSSPLLGFRELVQGGFTALATWLEEEESGRRGELFIPESPSPSIIGTPISQTPLRDRDRAVLGGFFGACERQLAAGFDPVLLLRRWSGRSRLTNNAYDALFDPDRYESMDAALRNSRARWDGSFLDENGCLRLAASLRLLIAPGSVGLRLVVPSLTQPQSAYTAERHKVELRPYPDSAGLPTDILSEQEPLLELEGRRETIAPFKGDTLFFELGSGGLEQVPAARSSTVWVLTRDTELLDAHSQSARHYRATLPEPWALFADLDPDELPAWSRVTEEAEASVRGAELVGGLALGDGAWLSDHPPRVICDLPEPAPLLVDGSDHGYLDPGEPLELEDLAGRAGIHTVEVAGLFRLDFELREDGLREGIGGVSRYPKDPRLGPGGAISEARDGEASGPRVAGAASFGLESEWRVPLTVTFNATAHVIYGDGRVAVLSPPEPPVWLTQVGLPEALTRWEIPDGDSVAWICVVSDPHPRVIACEPVEVTASKEVLELAEWFAGEPVVGDEEAEARWRALVERASSLREAIGAE
jgi:hypothetical protein